MISSSEREFHNSMIEALTEPAFIFSEDGSFLFGNKSGGEFLKTLSCVPENRPGQYDAFLQVLRSSGDGEKNAIILGGTPYEIATGAYDDKKILRLLPRYEDEHMVRLSQSLDIMPWGILTIDASTQGAVCVFSNPKAEEFLNLPHQKIVGSPVREILNSFSLAENIAGHLHGMETSCHDHETKRDGRVIWYRLHFIPYVRRKNYCLLVIEDTTEHKIREGQYFQAQRLEALGQLAGGVAHDFNNILSIVDGYARVGKKSVSDRPDIINFFERIMQAVQRGSSLTNRLLTFGRHKAIKDGIVDLGQLVQDQESLLRPLIDASISFSITTEDGISVEVPPDNICQILLNLCINARDAMPDGGTLSIECGKTRNARAFLRVSDTGTGIPPEIRAKIFDPFFTTKDHGKGTGLGLSMVYGLVREMRGEIDVASRPGEGAVFTIVLPLSEKPVSAPEIVEDRDGKIHLDGFTAMIAEDEPALLDLVSGMLEDMGAKVIRASNGNEALLLQDDFEGDIDFLLTDVVMPELNGVKLAELFGSVRPESKIMFMSGYPADGQMARVALPERAFFLSKPIDFEKLSNVLKNMTRGDNENIEEDWHAIAGQWKKI